ncbi:MAG: TonB-dependent siderophore receptor [Xanthobacteraceae bacterium]|jgi:iron complex outermembrane receptor protein|nr:TonB-dependent siderophore receptor [Xanthobacteraceae bacterium]
MVRSRANGGEEQRRRSIGAYGRRGLIPLLLMTSCLSGAALPQAALAQASAQLVSFSIPAQPLAGALSAFSRTTGWEVGYSSQIVRGKTSQALSGAMTPAQALEKLLAGSGLSIRFTGPTTAALVDPAVSAVDSAAGGSILLDTIDVQGEAQSDGVVPLATTTGSKVDTPILEIPQTVNVITRDQLDIQKPDTVMQAVAYTPGVNSSFIGPASMGEDSYVMVRGWKAGQYLDGLRTGGNITGTYSGIDPYLLESIQVLKGPSSTLYGQGTPGGLVDISSKMPTSTPLRELQFQTGSFGRIQGAFDLGGAIDEDGQFLYRLTGIARTGGTQFGHDTKDEKIAIAPAISWAPTDDTKLTVLAKYQYTPNMTGYQFLPALGTVLPNPNGPISDRLWGGDPTQDNSWLEQTQVGYRFEHRFNEVWQIRQNVRYENIKSNHLFAYTWGLDGADPSMQVANRNTTSRISDYDRFNVDNQVLAEFATGALDHRLILGADYQWYAVDQSGGAGTASPLNLYYPIYLGANAPVQTVSSDQTLWQTGLYAEDQIELGRWLLTLGGRYDWSGSDTTNLMVEPNTTTKQDDEAFSGRVGLSYQFDGGLAPYVSYSTSFEPLAGTTYESTPFEPTTGKQLEGGIKYKPEGYNALIQASVFEITQQNVLTEDPLHVGYSVQTGEIRSRGFEIEAKASLADGLDLILGYAYLDSRVTKDNNPDYVGNVPVNTPRNTASIWIDYTFQSGPLDGLMLGAGVRYIGESYGTFDNEWTWGVNQFSGLPSIVPDYTLVDAAIRYDFSKKYPSLKGLVLSVNATNLFDEAYVAGCTSAWSCYYGTARTVYGTLSYKF